MFQETNWIIMKIVQSQKRYLKNKIYFQLMFPYSYSAIMKEYSTTKIHFKS